MNPYYAVMESRHRWLILAGLSFGAAFVGAIMMLAWNWPHVFIQVWFYVGAALTVVFLAQAVRAWWSTAESYLQTPTSQSAAGGARSLRGPSEAPGSGGKEEA